MTKIQLLLTTSIFLYSFKKEYSSALNKNYGPTFKLIRGNLTNYKIEDVEKEEDLEYPRNNPSLLQKVQEMWQNYYLCLEKKADVQNKIEIVRLIEGQYTEFKCNFCPRPFQNYEEIVWKYKTLSQESNIKEPEYLDLTPSMKLTQNKTLLIFSVVEDISGLYSCFQKRSAISVYILEVAKNDTIERVETSHTEIKENIEVEGAVLNVNYKWNQWTDCSSCGTVGRKFKYGFCFLTVNRNPKACNYASPADDVSSNTESPTSIEKFLKNLSSITHFVKRKNTTLECKKNFNWTEFIDKFETGIPCSSSYLPKEMLQSTQKYTSVKAVVKFCLVPCQKPEVFEVLDSFGRLVELANNSAGIYSVFQNLPPLPPETERRSITAEFGESITIQCPGTLLINVPVTWKVNNKFIFPDVIANESNRRITIDLVNRIHIKKLRLRDSRTYSCWQRDKLAGTVKLSVEQKLKIRFNHHVILISVLTTIATFLFLGLKIITRELKSRKK